MDSTARLTVAPVDYEGLTPVRASFGAAQRAADRPVALQRQTGSGWQEVAHARMNGSGTVEFLASGASGTLRAVALPAGRSRAAVATPSAKAADQWRRVLNSGFDSSTLPAPWDYRLTDVYDAGGRWCSAPRKGNVDLGTGVVTLTMSRASKSTAARVSASAKRKQAQAGQKTVGCPQGVFDNAMVSTQDRFTIGSGMVAARVKFPGEHGAHASVWLQSDAGQELDMIETFGYGRGVTNVIHVKGKKYPADGNKAYVSSEAAASPQWWKGWHTVSVEWDRSSVRFRLDGRLTRQIKVALVPANYFLVISLLSSDWETYRLTKPDARPGSGVDKASVPKPELPFTMDVNWVRAWRTR
ncbi:MAG: glycoside hydrolase family 16 protein [Micropruina sp.]